MKILGYSGLDASVQFKQECFPDLDPRFYRVAQGFDSAATLSIDGDVVAAAAEERFIRDKATGTFPVSAIRFCLDRAGISLSELDRIAHCFNYDPHRAYFESSEYGQKQFAEVYCRDAQLRLFEEELGASDVAQKFVAVPHHLAHAASTFFPSGFDEALVLVCDGMGEVDSTTLFAAKGSSLEPLKRISASHSLGILYGVFTLYLGFTFNMDEYKIMGLAPHGDASRFIDDVRSLVHFKSDGTFAIPVMTRNKTLEEKETHAAVLATLTELFGPALKPGDEPEQKHVDIAAALQVVTQECLLHVLQHFAQKTGLENLCMAGGVALNCTANGVIERSGLFKNMFIQPAAGDDGASLGAALYVEHNSENDAKPVQMSMPFWGPEYSNEEIETGLDLPEGFVADTFQSFDKLVEASASRLAEGQAIAWFQGRMEFGPRALGNRSILADPRPTDMRERINRIIKKREGFRPFAPAVTREAAAEYFDLSEDNVDTYAHMLYVTDVRQVYRDKLPAITHVDGSARVQTVSKEDNERFWKLLNAFEKHSGFPILLNTSFNVQEPIVCSPQDALRTFAKTDLDALVLGEKLLITRK